MTFEEIRSAVMNLNVKDQQRFIVEVVPAIWPKACLDESCVVRVRELVDEATVKNYREQHMDSI
jgi:hypothetical protein